MGPPSAGRPVRRHLTGVVASALTAVAVLAAPAAAGTAEAAPSAGAAAAPAAAPAAGSAVAAAVRYDLARHRPRAAEAVRFAAAQLGKPYAWGGTGPRAYDCSGLTQASWRRAGVDIARVAAAQYWAGRRVHLRYAKPGDLVFWSSSRSPAAIYHVGLYLGRGLMIDAPHTGTRVRVDRVWGGVYPYATRL